MKKTNIAFSGFMATILLSAGAANAATQIASKQYVDTKESTILETVSNTYATTEKVNQIEQQVGTITDPETGLAATVEDLGTTVDSLGTTVESLGTTVGNAESGLVKDVNDLKTSVDSKLDTDTAVATYETLANKSQDLNTDAASTDKYPSAKAVVDWVNEKVTDGIEINTDKIQAGAVTSDKLAQDAVTSDKIADGAVGTTEIADQAVTTEKLSSDLAATIAGKEDKSNKTDVIGAESTSEQYPSAAAVYTSLQGKADTSALTTVSDKVNELDNALNNEETGLSAQITDVKNTADQALAGLENKQDTLTPEQQAAVDSGITADKVGIYDGYATEIAKKLDSTTAESTYATQTSLTEGLAKKQDTLGFTPEDSANKAKVIDTGNESSDTLFPTVGAITTWVSSEISDLSELPVNPGLIEDGTLAGSKLQNGAITTEKINDGAVTTDKIANGAVTTEKLGEDVTTTINSKANAADVYTKDETNSKIVELAVPQPGADCMAESGLCVLSVTPEGAYEWVNVTSPIE